VYQKGGGNYQIATKLPHGQKCTKRLNVIFSKWTKNIPTFQFQGPQKFTHIGIFGLEINHLATLIVSWKP
jgi:hypothetical protein